MSNQKKKTIIVGALGQVGRALFRAFKSNYQILEHDLKPKYRHNTEPVDAKADPETSQDLVMNICIPWSEDFEKIVKEYNQAYNPSLIIIHSSVRPSTTYELSKSGIPIVHSPVVFDDNKFDTIIYFRKMIGFDNPEHGIKAEEFLRVPFNTALIRGSINTELADVCLGLYAMSCRAITFEISKMFGLIGLDYAKMAEYILYNNVGYNSINNGAKMLQNLFPVLNKDDYRYKLIELLPKEMLSSFFVLAQKSYDIEKNKQEELKKVEEEQRHEQRKKIAEDAKV